MLRSMSQDSVLSLLFSLIQHHAFYMHRPFSREAGERNLLSLFLSDSFFILCLLSQTEHEGRERERRNGSERVYGSRTTESSEFF